MLVIMSLSSLPGFMPSPAQGGIRVTVGAPLLQSSGMSSGKGNDPTREPRGGSSLPHLRPGLLPMMPVSSGGSGKVGSPGESREQSDFQRHSELLGFQEEPQSPQPRGQAPPSGSPQASVYQGVQHAAQDGCECGPTHSCKFI